MNDKALNCNAVALWGIVLALIDCKQQYINAMSNFILVKVVMFFI